jgi:hypothetical protein
MGHDREPRLRKAEKVLVATHVEPEGAIYFVKDSAWGFSSPGRDEHPGLCVWFAEDLRTAVFLKGVDAAHARFGAVIVEPTRANGLSKPTAFQLVPRALPRRLVELMHKSPRLIGRLDPSELAAIRAKLARLFGRGGGGR